jgi:hypothetical protein
LTKKKKKVSLQQGYGPDADLWCTDDAMRGEGLGSMMEEYDELERQKESDKRIQVQLVPEGVRKSARIAQRAKQ